MGEIQDKLRYRGNVCISGLTASGKTTHSHMLAGELGLTYISGSQIQLNFMGVSPIQSREFWITPQAKSFWDGDQFNRIDAELLRLEEARAGCIFDTSTMPWRHKKESLCIWLESSLASRVIKSVVSHHGDGSTALKNYEALIQHKDASTISLYRDLYGISIGSDLGPFDLVLNISELISVPTIDASLESIRVAHKIIRNAAAYYLTGNPEFFDLYQKALNERPDIMMHDGLEEARHRSCHS